MQSPVTKKLLRAQRSAYGSSTNLLVTRAVFKGGGYGFKPPEMSGIFIAALNLQRLNCDFASVAPCSACLLGLHLYNCHHSILCNTMILTF